MYHFDADSNSNKYQCKSCQISKQDWIIPPSFAINEEIENKWEKFLNHEPDKYFFHGLPIAKTYPAQRELFILDLFYVNFPYTYTTELPFSLNLFST